MNNIIIRKYKSPCGILVLGSHEGELCMCDWENSELHPKSLERIKKHLRAEAKEGNSGVIEQAAGMLDEYFSGKRRDLNIALGMTGTNMQKQVWEELLQLPYGMTTSYGDIAHRIGRPKAVRAVANAIGANPISIFVPCHRIVGGHGQLTGYRGGLPAKQFLLSLENQAVQ